VNRQKGGHSRKTLEIDGLLVPELIFFSSHIVCLGSEVLEVEAYFIINLKVVSATSGDVSSVGV
jgi:hypothetical protein